MLGSRGAAGNSREAEERAVRVCGDACPGHVRGTTVRSDGRSRVDGGTETLVGFSAMLGIYSKDRGGIKGQEIIFGVTEETRCLLRT